MTDKDLFPELKNLRGGRKQAWVNQHLDVIVALNDQLGFEQTRQLLHMKADTLAGAINRAEGFHRPVITMAEKAMGRVALNENKVNELVKELYLHAEVLESHDATLEVLQDNLRNFFEFQAAANKMMASVMSSMETKRFETNFTEHIASAPRQKVSPSNRAGRGQHFLYHGPKRKRLPEPVLRDLQHRKRTSKRRPSGA